MPLSSASERAPHSAAQTPIPVHVLTGFLGSGKTSLLRKLLSDPALADTAVVINEFGEVGLDHLLVRELAEDVVLLASGCVCCALKDDLSTTLADLHRGALTGEIPRFARVVLETTGLADPLPIMRLLRLDARLTRYFELGRVATTVDGVNGLHTLESYGEAVQQIAAADCLVITKTDLISESELERVSHRLGALNPTARRIASGRNDPLMSGDLFESSSLGIAHDWSSIDPLPQERHLGTSSAGVSSFVIAIEQPVELDAFIDWLDLLLASRGDSILRVKGYLAAKRHEQPLAIQGVQHVLDRPEPLRDWPNGERRTQLVFIAKHLTKTAIERSLPSIARTSAQ